MNGTPRVTDQFDVISDNIDPRYMKPDVRRQLRKIRRLIARAGQPEARLDQSGYFGCVSMKVRIA